MVIIQYGLAKSGSSFIFQILTDILQNRFRCWEDYQKNRNSFVPKEYHSDYIAIEGNELSELVSAVPLHEFFLFKTHDGYGGKQIKENEAKELSEKIKDWINDKELKVIATVRDPRDMCLSYLDHAEAYRRGEKDFFDNEIITPFDAVENVKNEYKVLSNWMRHNRIHWISYPQICNEPLRVLESIKKYIGLYNIDSTAYVEKLLENRNRIHQYNKGYVDRWKKELSKDDALRLSTLLEEELTQYNKLVKRSEMCIDLS